VRIVDSTQQLVWNKKDHDSSSSTRSRSSNRKEASEAAPVACA
jgi:hypothetical protein